MRSRAASLQAIGKGDLGSAHVIAARIHDLEVGSISGGPGRLAQPDEVWNYGRGDGVEKALLLAAVFRARWQIEISAMYRE